MEIFELYNKQVIMIGVDLFAGAGGMSLGAQMSGVDVRLAIEIDSHAALTYRHNHPQTKVLEEDINNIQEILVTAPRDEETVLFGGPPCQGFSTSNQRTRTRENPNNWLFKEFVRIASIWQPDWIILENVKGITNIERGWFLNSIVEDFEEIGYSCSHFILCASDYGVPQKRHRFFLIGSRRGIVVEKPEPLQNTRITVQDALSDLPLLHNGASEDELPYRDVATNDYARLLRGNMDKCSGHLVSRNSELVLSRYSHIPQGGNWQDIPQELMKNYKDHSRCHTGIYHRLRADQPSVVLGNYRKNMLIHPFEDRGLSVREAARLQSFPDSYEFKGLLGYKQQQVGNAVPPLLAQCVFNRLITN